MKKQILAFILAMLLAFSVTLGAFAEPEATDAAAEVTETADAQAETAAVSPTAAATAATYRPAKSVSGMLDRLQSGGYDVKEVGRSDSLTLYLVADNDLEEKDVSPSLIVVDNRTGHEWYSWVPFNRDDNTAPDSMIEGSMNESWRKKLRSIFVLYYAQKGGNKSVSDEMPSCDAGVTTSSIENGVKMSFKFEDLGISLAISFFIDGDALVTNINADDVAEETVKGNDYLITDIEVMPMLGASAGDADGYVLLPDGSGALVEHKSYITVNNVQKCSWEIYGQHNVNIAEYETREATDLKNAMIPVFGVKQGNDAFVAIMTEGEADSIVNFYPSGSVMALNRVSGDYVYRRFYDTPKSTGNGETVRRAENNLIKNNHATRYVFLAGKDNGSYSPDYSGMANAYRDYLTENELIGNVLEGTGEMPFVLDLFMGVKAESLLFDEYVEMTSFEDASAIYERFLAEGIGNISINLVGWNTDGYGVFPDSHKANTQLGGSGGLEAFIDNVKGKGGKVYLQLNAIDADSDNGGFSTRNDVIYSNGQMLITDSTGKKYIISPLAVKNNADRTYLPAFKNYGASGVTYEKVGTYLYNDYHASGAINRVGSQSVWQELLSDTRDALGAAAVLGGNAYTFKFADRLGDIPTSDSGYFIVDETVPFYQMVVHGYIPYTSKAANLFHDHEKQLLKWIEYGCTPYYELTEHESELLKDTDYNALFTSKADDWFDLASDNYKETVKNLGDLWKTPMTAHEKLATDLYRVDYENGDCIYINYSNGQAEVDGVTVDAIGYKVVKGGAAKVASERPGEDGGSELPVMLLVQDAENEEGGEVE